MPPAGEVSRELIEPRVGNVDQPIRADRHTPRRAAGALFQVRKKLGANVGGDGGASGSQRNRPPSDLPGARGVEESASSE